MMATFLQQKGLGEEDLHLFMAALEARHIKKGESFLAIGQPCRYLALLESGFLRTYHINDSGQEVTTAFNGPDSVCSAFYSFYSHNISREGIVALTDCDLQVLSYQALQQLYATRVGINVFGRKVLEQACIERDVLINQISHQPAREKYTWFLKQYAPLAQVAQVQHIASFLGIHPETLSRVRRSLLS